MNVLEKILEEIKEVEKKFVVGHEVLFSGSRRKTIL